MKPTRKTKKVLTAIERYAKDAKRISQYVDAIPKLNKEMIVY